MTQTLNAAEEYIAGVDGFRIFLRSWHPAGAVTAVMVIVHGFNSHSGEYEWAAEQLTSQGLAVYAADLRGRGRSDGERFYIAKFDSWVKDLVNVVALAKGRDPHVPVFVLGHSAGGVVASTYALDYEADIAGLICESFAHEVPAPDFALAVFKGLSHVFPHTHILRLKNEDFSRDAKVVAAKNADPLLDHEVQPTQTLAEMVRADERLARNFANITLPVLILHGTADKVTRPSGSQRFYNDTGSRDKTLKLYEGHFHDLLNDRDKELVMADITKWVTARIAARP